MNMNLYVISTFKNFRDARAAIDLFQSHGHTITHDWTRSTQFGPAGELTLLLKHLTHEEAHQVAAEDLGGVWNADAVVVLPHQELYGGMVEIGLAIANDVEVWMVGKPERDSVFFHLPHVRHFLNLDHVIMYMAAMG